MIRFAWLHTGAAFAMCVSVLVVEAEAQGAGAPTGAVTVDAEESVRVVPAALPVGASTQTRSEALPLAPAAPVSAAIARAPRRPGALVPLYLSFGTLQALDMHATSHAIGRGAVEANPVMKGVVGNTAGMLAVKAGGTAAVILVSEKMWRKNKPAAVVFMLATNAALSWVVQHNYRAMH